MESSYSESMAGPGGMTDLHSHLMPGVDDGATNDEEAREGLIAMRDAGVRQIATTPHVDASAMLRASWERRAAALDAAWERLQAIAAEAVPDVALYRAAEVKLDVPDADLSDARVRLGGGPAALVEFAYFTVPAYSDRMIGRIAASGWVPLIAHPERYRGIASDLRVVATWRMAGAWIQVNAGSFTGRYGAEAKANAISLLTGGQIDCIASDFHSRGTPELRAARTWLESIGATDHAELLLDVNPARILGGEAPLPVPTLERKPGLMSRIWNVVKGS